MKFRNVLDFFHIRKNILSKLSALLIIVILLSLILVTVIWNNHSQQTVNELTFSHATDLIRNANSKFENEIYSTIRVLKHIASDKRILNYRAMPVEGKQKLYDYYVSLSENINGIAVIYPDDLYSTGNSYFSEELINSDIYYEVLKAKDNQYIFNRKIAKGKEDAKTPFIGIKLDHGNTEGILIADIKSNVFVKHFGISNMKGIFRNILADTNGKIIFSNERNLPSESIEKLMNLVFEKNVLNSFFDIELDNEKYTVMARRLSLFSEWTNITFFPKSTLYRSYYETLYSVIWIILTVVIFTVLFILIILTSITKKYKKLIRYTEHIDLKNINNTIPIKPDSVSDELDLVANKIYNMVSTLAEQVNLISDMEEKKHIQELEALRAQINPHFIYNSLNVIQTLAETQKNTRISEIANSLSSLLRYSATNTDGFVTLKDEIEHATNYITIMQNKFLNKINLIIDTEPETLNSSILKMTLQPLIENSIRHGLKDFPDNYIIIRAYSDEDTVTVQIIDNGVGIEKDKLEEIMKFSEKSSGHLGLKNVDKRIKLTFGAEYGVEIYSTPNVQTIVSITIPFIDNLYTEGTIEKEDIENE